jgi:hypothetical protein
MRHVLVFLLLFLGTSPIAHPHEAPMDGAYGEIVRDQMARNNATGSNGYDAQAVAAPLIYPMERFQLFKELFETLTRPR